MKPSVAALALLATNFESCDAALNFASDDSSQDHDLSGPKQMRHPFIGCLALERIDLNDDIQEAASGVVKTKQDAPLHPEDAHSKVIHKVWQHTATDDDDLEAQVDKEICYICHKVKGMHDNTTELKNVIAVEE